MDKIALSGTNADNVGFLKRYGPLFCKKLSFARGMNSILATMGFAFKKSIVHGHPLTLKFETSAICNLSCPGCMHGNDSTYFKRNMMIELELFQKVIDEVGKHLFMAIMYHRGEAFFNKDLFAMIEYLQRYNVGSTVSSNFSLNFTDHDFKNMVSSGLNHLLLSIDGTTQDVYREYRKGGNLELVKHNVRELVSFRNKMNSKNPVIEQQFIIFPHNAHQIKEVEEFARSLGIDRVSFVGDMAIEHDIYLGADKKNKQTTKAFMPKKYLPLCDWPWFAGVIKWNGEVLPCCDYDWKTESSDFGNAYHESFIDIWNSPRYIALRNSLANMMKNDTLDPYCIKCPALHMRKKSIKHLLE